MPDELQYHKSNAEDLQSLLQERSKQNYHISRTSAYNPKEQPLRANKSANLTDLIHMISELSTKAMRKLDVVFEPDEGDRPKVDMDIQLDKPHIYYDVISRVPMKELKPRIRQEIVETHDDKENIRQGRVFGQKFECIVQFNIMAADYKTADRVMHIFEELIFDYTSYLKENGVAEIFFMKQMTDRNLDQYRQSLSVRSLQYYVEIEQLHTVFDEAIIEGIITD